MRCVLALLLVTLALSSTAGAAPTPQAQTKTPAKKAPTAAAVAAPSAALPPLIPLASGRAGGDAGQCRAVCARGYYFCKAGDDDICPSQWAQCNARCTATYKRLGS